MSNQYYTGIHVLSEINYQKPGIAAFPIFKDLPLKAGFSWGKDAYSMSYKNNDKDTVNKVHEDFFKTLDLPSKRILIDPNLPATNELLEVPNDLFADQAEIITGSNILFTKSNPITLMAHPGDCPCLVIFTKDNNNQSLLGLVHSGRKQTDKRLAEQAIDYIKIQNIHPKDILVGICPGISKEHYFVPKAKWQNELPNAEKWGKYKEEKITNDEERIYLDLQGYIIEQLIQTDIPEENIQLYTVDTYDAAEKGEGFSHRYATVTNQPEKDGRFLIAASLS